MKKVSIVVGAVGALPAMTMLTPAVANAATPAHGAGKSVRNVNGTDVTPDAGCTGKTGYRVNSGSYHTSFWSAPKGNQTCIGTIKVVTATTTFTGGSFDMSAHVERGGKNYCNGTQNDVFNGSHTFGCHAAFDRTALKVWGGYKFCSSFTCTTWHRMSDKYPFHGKL